MKDFFCFSAVLALLNGVLKEAAGSIGMKPNKMVVDVRGISMMNFQLHRLTTDNSDFVNVI